MELTPKKNQWKIINDPNRFVLAICGRRFGKTQSAAIKMILKAVNNPKQNIAYIAPNYQMAKQILWNRLIEMLPKEYVKKMNESSPQTLVLKNGSTITLYGGHNYDSLRGIALDLAVLDEIQDQHEDLWKKVIYPALSDRKGEALLIGTPKGQSNFTFNLWNSGVFSTHSYTTLDGGNVSVEEVELAKRNLDPNTFSQEYLAEFISNSGLVYYSFKESLKREHNFNPSKDAFVTFDFNFGTEIPLGCYLIQDIGQKSYHIYKEFSSPNTRTDEMTERVRFWLREQGFKGTITITGDHAGNQQRSNSSRTDFMLIEEILGKEFTIQRKTRPTKSIRDRVASLNAAMSHEKITFDPSCTLLFNDFIRIGWNDDNTLDSRDKKLTHCSDAITYFTYNFMPVDKKPMKSFTR